MTQAVDFEALAARCEAATGEDTLELINLECDICRALGIETSTHEAPFTASLDAAMTLVPEGCLVAVTNCDADSNKPDFSKASAIVAHKPQDVVAPTIAATPALALCAAALRARDGEGV